MINLPTMTIVFFSLYFLSFFLYYWIKRIIYAKNNHESYEQFILSPKQYVATAIIGVNCITGFQGFNFALLRFTDLSESIVEIISFFIVLFIIICFVWITRKHFEKLFYLKNSKKKVENHI